MIADATKDARERAKKIAENAGSSLGSLKKPAWELYRLQHPIPEKTIHGAVHSTPLQRERSQHYHQIRISGRLNYLKSEFP